jgi:alpha-galactosidase
MRKLGIRLVFCGLFWSLLIQHALATDLYDLTGTWIVDAPSPQGMTPEIVEFRRVQEGLSGIWSSRPRWIDGRIGDIRLDGASLSFRVKYDSDESFSALWKGQFDNKDRFTLRWMWEDHKNPGREFPVWSRSFRRATPDALVQLERDAPQTLTTYRLPLPGLRDLPPNNLALTPPMGWNSWNSFQDGIDDKTAREIADALVSSGLRDAGYVYVNIDDGWQGRRDDHGTLQPNSKFPDMRGLARYLHAKGLKFGIYTVAGPVSCLDRVGSHGYEKQDAIEFAEWGADYLKYDWCSADLLYSFETDGQAIYQKMGEALRATGRPIVYSLCSPAPRWGRQVGGNLWRTGTDSFLGERWHSLSTRFETNGNPKDNVPGGWNDPDMLLVGMEGLTLEESRTGMTLWSILAAPLILGNDVRHMTSEVKAILSNKEVIAIDQDPLGRQGRRDIQNGETEVWTKPLSDGSTAVALFNRGAQTTDISVKWSALGFSGPQQVRDLWRHADLGKRKDGYSATVPSHGSVLLRVRGADQGR